MARPSAPRRRVRALMAVTTFVSGHGMIAMDPDSEREELRFPLVPETAITQLIREGRVADDVEEAEVGTPVDLPALRKEYEATMGKKPFGGWGADELRRRMADAIPVSGTSEGGPSDDAPIA